MSVPPEERLRIWDDALIDINRLFADPNSPVMSALLTIVEKYGGPEEINRKAKEARHLPSLLGRLESISSPYLQDLEWLKSQRDSGSFVRMEEYRRAVVCEDDVPPVDHHFAVTLEISALQYFPWLIEEAKQAIAKRELMPGRYIRVRNMKEQETDQGDILAVAAAMQIIGATYVETLDTKGTDGANVHLGGPETITGYFGGIGQPNDYALKWADEFLYYYTNYGVQQVLNVNPGTVLVGYLLYKLGIDNQFKISVFMGNDNPYAVMWTLIAARLLARPDGTTPLVGLNFSNSVNNETIERSAQIRKALGLEDVVRFEHHITETWKNIVRQPYCRREELVEVASKVRNISAKHEGGEIDVEASREHPSDVFDYFQAKCDVESCGKMPLLLQNYLDKHEAVNKTAAALLAQGIPVIAAHNLHSVPPGRGLVLPPKDLHFYSGAVRHPCPGESK